MSDKMKSILSAIGFLKGQDPKIVSALVDDVELQKALDGANRSEGLKHYAHDHWNEGHTNKSATAEEVNVGPAEHSSGGGAEKMVRDYSSPAHQMHGVAATPEKLDAMMRGFGKSFEMLAEGQAKIAAILVAVLKKAEEEEEDEEESEEESEVVEINASRGKSRLARAKSLTDKLAALKSELEDEHDKDARKALRTQIKSLTKKIGVILGKARTNAYAAKDAELKKSIRAFILKADINVVQEEEEEEDEEEDEEGEGKSAAAAEAAAKKAAEEAATKKAAEEAAAKAAAEAEAKAKTNTAGNRSQPDGGAANQAAQAKAVEKVQTDIGEALKGLSMLQGTVKDLMEVIAGRSKLADKLPVIKATTPTDKIKEALDAAETSGTLNDVDLFAARDIATKLELVKSGTIDASIVQDRLRKATTAVQLIFKDAIAA